MQTKTYDTPLQALAEAKALTWAFIKTNDKVTLGPVPAEVSNIDLSTLLEARFFDESTEIRLFLGSDGLRAVRLTGEMDDDLLVESYPLAAPEFGKSLKVAKLLQADEDGQINITAQRLCGWKGE